MAAAPQSATRAAPRHKPAPPSRAETAPSAARNTNDDSATQATSCKRRRPRRHADRQHGADGEARGRRERRLHRARGRGVGQAEFVARMGAEGVVRHELPGHLVGECRIEPALDVDARQLAPLAGRVAQQFGLLAGAVGLLGVGLRMDRDELAGGHRHRPGDQRRHAGQQDRAVVGARDADAEHEARSRHDAVVRAEHGRAQPADAVAKVAFGMAPADAAERRRRGRRGGWNRGLRWGHRVTRGAAPRSGPCAPPASPGSSRTRHR